MVVTHCKGTSCKSSLFIKTRAKERQIQQINGWYTPPPPQNKVNEVTLSMTLENGPLQSTK